MYIVHLKKELCTTFKSTINENVTDFIAQARLPVQVIISWPLIAPDWCAKKVRKNISSLIARSAQMQAAREKLKSLCKHISQEFA